MQRKSAFSRRLPDLVTEELVAVLSKKGASFEFKQLFDVVHDRLKKRNAASGGEEMLRLRAYEKLQHLVSRNMVKKNGKKYKGLASLANAIAPEEPLPAPQVPSVVSVKPVTAAAIKKPSAKKPSAKKPSAKKPSAKKPAVKTVKIVKTPVKKASAKPVVKTSPANLVKAVKKVKSAKAVKKVSKR
jgi:outer membrane biosynthesis protein TonB